MTTSISQYLDSAIQKTADQAIHSHPNAEDLFYDVFILIAACLILHGAFFLYQKIKQKIKQKTNLKK